MDDHPNEPVRARPTIRVIGSGFSVTESALSTEFASLWRVQVQLAKQVRGRTSFFTARVPKLDS